MFMFSERGSLLTTWGITLGLIFMVFGLILFISETYKRVKFKHRIYVD